MTVTMDLTPELAKTLRDAAEGSLSDASILQRALREVVARMQPTPLSATHAEPFVRVAGLHAGQTWLSDDFDEPLPESFLLGEG